MMISKRLACLVLPACLLGAQAARAQPAFMATPQSEKKVMSATPFQTNDGAIPPKSAYDGPMFALSHDWPKAPPPAMKQAPWQAAIHDGKITVKNAAAYAAALKKAVSKNAQALIEHYDSWNAAKAGWYNEPWLGSQREAIHGTYAAGDFTPDYFPGTGLQTEFTTQVLTYYDSRAATTLQKFWNSGAMKPNLTTAAAQFPEGAIVVKAAVFVAKDPKYDPGAGGKDHTINADWWDAMKGAQLWPMYVSYPTQKNADRRLVRNGYVAQFDIIVKDSQSAPKTGWVYMTLVYDSSAPGSLWDKMVPLGVQWGNDPQADKAGMTLSENWNNPKAPKYSTETLGWGGRLSGPNDGARNDIAVNGQIIKKAPDSSCMSCHSTAEWDVQKHKMIAFLLPSFPTDSGPGFQLCGNDGKPDPNGQYICSPPPGSKDWMKWFQDRPGTEPMDAGSIATDFDEVFSFKSLKLWWAAVGPKNQPLPLLLRVPSHGTKRFNQYTGAPLPPDTPPQQ